ncbi:hypothetical protein [Gimesia sp.]|uniref:hypothetical protein n=1 Tax=Gimesia sp. TaxID=2024833 RepID=UPI003A9260E5
MTNQIIQIFLKQQSAHKIPFPVFAVRIFLLLLSVTLSPVFARGQEKEQASSVELQNLIQAIEEQENLYRNLRLNLTCSEVAHAGWFQSDDSRKVHRKSMITLVVQGKKFAEWTMSSGAFVNHFFGGSGWENEGFPS